MAERISHSSINHVWEKGIDMTATAVRDEEWNGGEEWLGAYPPALHALLLNSAFPIRWPSVRLITTLA